MSSSSIELVPNEALQTHSDNEPKIDFKDRLHPRNSPEIALQTYEYLRGDSQAREAQKRSFIANELVTPNLDYPYLSEDEFHQQISKLDDILQLLAAEPSHEDSQLIKSTITYRMAEAYWLIRSKDIIDQHNAAPEQVSAQNIREVQSLNEGLYGKPDQEIVDQIIGEIWHQIEGKKLAGSALQLKNELLNGADLTIAGQEVRLHAFDKPLGQPRLPEIPIDLLTMLNRKLRLENADIVNLVYDYWDSTVRTRPENEQVFTSGDCMKLFNLVLHMRDPDNISKIQVRENSSGTGLSWNTPKYSIEVGTKQRNSPINSPQKMLGKIMHEFVIHAGKAINGLKTNLPILGTGLFTEGKDGMCDYLAFEEGLGSLAEQSILGAAGGWESSNINNYLATTLAYKGNTFRQTYETLWRTTALMQAKNGQELKDTEILAAKRKAWGAAVRVYRGTPSNMARKDSEGKPIILTYNKDLAYMHGRLRVLKYWEQYKNYPDMINFMFAFKTDPSDPTQLKATKKHYDLAA